MAKIRQIHEYRIHMDKSSDEECAQIMKQTSNMHIVIETLYPKALVFDHTIWGTSFCMGPHGGDQRCHTGIFEMIDVIGGLAVVNTVQDKSVREESENV